MAATTTLTKHLARVETALDLQDIEMTLTLVEWHRCRDANDDTSVILPHQAQQGPWFPAVPR